MKKTRDNRYERYHLFLARLRGHLILEQPVNVKALAKETGVSMNVQTVLFRMGVLKAHRRGEKVWNDGEVTRDLVLKVIDAVSQYTNEKRRQRTQAAQPPQPQQIVEDPGEYDVKKQDRLDRIEQKLDLVLALLGADSNQRSVFEVVNGGKQ